jgi:Gamma-glutamyl cyclotransferase, AIG2-like
MRPARCVRLLRGHETAFFFYGTLMDRDSLSEALGRWVAPRALRPARLLGRRRAAVRGASYPVVVSQRGTVVKGVILRGVRPTEQARLSAYEGDGYELERALAELPGQRRVRVFLFKPKPGAYTVTGRPWTLARWRLHHKPSEMRVVAETSLAPLAGRGLG